MVVTLSLSHREAQDSLAQYLRVRYTKPPMVFTEVALSGSRGSAGRLDVVALWVSGGYRNSVVHGYEVKVSRSDLLRDLRSGKYRRYLTQVDRLYFALPKEIARADEIPAGVGVVVLDGTSWHVSHAAKKQARKQDPSLPWRLLWRAHAEVNSERSERRRLQAVLRDRARYD